MNLHMDKNTSDAVAVVAICLAVVVVKVVRIRNGK